MNQHGSLCGTVKAGSVVMRLQKSNEPTLSHDGKFFSKKMSVCLHNIHIMDREDCYVCRFVIYLLCVRRLGLYFPRDIRDKLHNMLDTVEFDVLFRESNFICDVRYGMAILRH
jgi:hypothetical protein